MARITRILAHTSTQIAVQEGTEAAGHLVRASARRYAALAVFSGLCGAGLAAVAPLPVGAAYGALVVVGLLTLGAWVVGADATRARVALGVWAAAVVVGIAALESIWIGAGLTLGLGLAAAEAAGATLVRVSPDVARVSALLAPGAVATAWVYLAPASWVTEFGGAMGAAIAVGMVVVARVGEHAAPFRHARGQVDAAALSRVTEIGRWIFSGFVSERA